MMLFFINPLSAHGQCHTVQDAEDAIASVVKCFEYLRFGIFAETIALLYDPTLESRNLVADDVFAATIQKINGVDARDIRTKWFLYTRKAKLSEFNSVPAHVQAGNGICGHFLHGSLPLNVDSNVSGTLSLGHSQITQCETLLFTIGGNEFTLRNAYSRDSLIPLLPKYERHEKHRNEPYFDEIRKENVAPMPLNDEDAQNLILTGVECSKDIVAYHLQRKEIYRFKVTNGNVYHGFRVEEKEIPSATLSKIKGD